MAAGRKIIRGITWIHSRGYVPLAATSQRFAEHLHHGGDARAVLVKLERLSDEAGKERQR